MEVMSEIRFISTHYSNDLSYMPEGSNRWRKRPLPSSANNRRMHRCAGSKNGGWGQSLFNKVLRWAYFMKWNLRFGLVWTFWRLLCSLISLTEKQKKSDFLMKMVKNIFSQKYFHFLFQLCNQYALRNFLSLCDLEAAPEEAMQLRRLIKSSNESLGPHLLGKLEFGNF